MTADKFAETLLPHSRIRIKTPLIELGFDTVSTVKNPFGRGVIPDHIVSLILDELNYRNGDAILNYTLDLIAAQEREKPAGLRALWIGLFCGALALAAGAVFIRIRNRKMTT